MHAPCARRALYQKPPIVGCAVNPFDIPRPGWNLLRGLSSRRCGAKCSVGRVRPGENEDCTFSIPVTLGLRGLPSLRRTLAATHRACARTNLPDLRFAVGGLRLSCGADLGGYPAAPSMLRAASPLSPRRIQRELPCLSESLVLRRWKPLRS